MSTAGSLWKRDGATERRPSDVWFEFHRVVFHRATVTGHDDRSWEALAESLKKDDFFARRWPASAGTPEVEREFYLRPHPPTKKKTALGGSEYELVRRDSGTLLGCNIDSGTLVGCGIDSDDHVFHNSLEGSPAGFPFEAFVPGAADGDEGCAALRRLFDYDVLLGRPRGEANSDDRSQKIAIARSEGWFERAKHLLRSVEEDPFCWDRGDRRATVTFYVNASAVKRVLEDPTFPCCPFEWLLVRVAPPDAPVYAEAVDEQESHVPFPDESDQGSLSCLRTPLYPHQRHALEWMRSIEAGGIHAESIPEESWLATTTGVVVDRFRGKLRPKGCRADALPLTARGGIFADEMGLGKTLVLLSLAFGGQDNGGQEEDAKEEGDDGPVLRSRLKEVAHRTNATLIVCPSHLVSQWAEETAKHVPQERRGRVIALTTVAQLRQVTNADVRDASVVLLSASMLTNANARLALSDFGPALDESRATHAATAAGELSRKRPRESAKPAQKKSARSTSTGKAATSKAGEALWKTAFCFRDGFGSTIPGSERPVRSAYATASAFRDRLRRAGTAAERDRLLEAFWRAPAPNVLHFAWRRVVVDEAHEFVHDPHVFETLVSAVARNRWLVTGTPWPLFARWRTTAQFLGTSPKPDALSEWTRRQSLAAAEVALRAGMRRRFYWRNTKQSADRYPKESSLASDASSLIEPQASLFGRGIVSTVEWVRLTPIELAIYRQACAEFAGEERLVQICCHPQISKEEREALGAASAELSLEEIRRRLVEHHAQKVERQRESLAQRRRTLETELGLLRHVEDRLAAALKQETGEADPRTRALDEKLLRDSVETRSEIVRALQLAVAAEESRLAQSESTLRFLRSVGERKGDDSKCATEDECPVCYGDSGAPRAFLRGCGHTACSECLTSWLAAQRHCPTCRAPVDLGKNNRPENGFWIVAAEKDSPSEEDALIAELGSKVARLVTLLRELRRTSTPEEPKRAIVFSQFDGMLHRVGGLLKQRGVRAVYAKGSVHAKTASIRKFKTDPDVDALLLSVEHSASGTNLQEATHVFFLDALLGERARTTMLQAIGRVHRIGQTRPVHVHHLLAEETLEPELHGRLIGTME